MIKPFFSIITCTLNSQEFISANIDSVKSQTFENYEQIIIDGYSTDGTIETIRKKTRSGTKQIKVFLQRPNGIASAFNYGILKSTGDYLIFLNSDDSFFDNNVLSNVQSFLIKNEKLDWLYGKINVIEDNGTNIGTFPNRKIFQTANKTLLKYINYIPHQAVFIKRKIFEKHGLFSESLKYAMDIEYWLRIRNKTKWEFADITIANYRIHKKARSSSLKNKLQNEQILDGVVKKYLNNFDFFVYKLLRKYIIGPRSQRLLR